MQCKQFCALTLSSAAPSLPALAISHGSDIAGAAFPSRRSKNSYTPAGQYRPSGPPKIAALTAAAALAFLSLRCGGWSWSWSTPERERASASGKVTRLSGGG